MKKLNTALERLESLAALETKDLAWSLVYDAVRSLPLYGRTRASNFLRLVDAARSAAGLALLRFDFISWPKFPRMHANVTESLDVLQCRTHTEAVELLAIFTALLRRSYVSPPRTTSRVDDLRVGDLALIACEYACLRAEVAPVLGVRPQDACAAMLRRLPRSVRG